MLALTCYGKVITSATKSVNGDEMKRLNKHPRLFKKAAKTLKELMTQKIRTMQFKNKIAKGVGGRGLNNIQVCSFFLKLIRNQKQIIILIKSPKRLKKLLISLTIKKKST